MTTNKTNLISRFNLKTDLDEKGTLEAVSKGVQFRGASVWTLIFAMLIASIGLNVNSTAVIIGAMLISPLMGPIMGAGVSLGVNNLELFKSSIRTLVVATVFGIAASTIYFLLSPLSLVQSELLARTQPTIYDVLIALCGGATGIIANSQKEKNINALSGVAIATALMPPLCTAGFGLSQGRIDFFLGALYLYCINATFICLASFVFVRALGFRPHVYVNEQTRKKVSRLMTAIILVMFVPSVYTSYKMITNVAFQSEANRFVLDNFHFSQTKVFETKFEIVDHKARIEVTLIGQPLSNEEKEKINEALLHSKLKEATLELRHLSPEK